MARLTYSTSAGVRAMQISRAKLHVFVEGRELDSYVYGRICHDVLPDIFSHRITRADELSSVASGGKQVLLRHFQKLRRGKHLTMNFKGEKSVALFFMDKDLDELLRTKRRSPHVVYTRSYDLEAEVFREGDIGDAIAAICSVSPSRVKQKQASSDWRQLTLAGWRPWVEFCVLSKTNPSLGLTNYGNVSLLHRSGELQMDPALQARVRKQLTAACSSASIGMAEAEAKAKRQVARFYRSSGGYEVFKGKWFPETLHALALANFPVEAKRASAFKKRLASHAAQTLRMEDPWTSHYSGPIRALLAAL